MASLPKYIKPAKGFKKVDNKNFTIGDSVKWTVNGAWRSGKVIEIVPPGSPPANKIYRKTVTATRDHESYVVKSDTHIVWPQVDGLESSREKLPSGAKPALSVQPHVAAKGVAQAKSVTKVDSSDYIKSLENAVITLSRSYLFNRDLFRSESGRGVLFEEVRNDFDLEVLYELPASKDVEPSVIKGILASRQTN